MSSPKSQSSHSKENQQKLVIFGSLRGLGVKRENARKTFISFISLVKVIRADEGLLGTDWHDGRLVSTPRFQRIEWGHIGSTCLRENGKTPLFALIAPGASPTLRKDFTFVALLRLSIGNRHWPHLLALSSPPPCQASRQLPAELSLGRFYPVFTTRRHFLLEEAKIRS